MQTHSRPEEANMNNARTIHLQRLDGCLSYDRFAKNAPAIVTPAIPDKDAIIEPGG
jgi:hypothetical protein